MLLRKEWEVGNVDSNYPLKNCCLAFNHYQFPNEMPHLGYKNFQSIENISK